MRVKTGIAIEWIYYFHFIARSIYFQATDSY